MRLALPNIKQHAFQRENGEYVFCLPNNDGDLEIVSRAQLLFETFIPHDTDCSFFIRKDHNNSNDALDNLIPVDLDTYNRYHNYQFEECLQYPGFFNIPKHYGRSELQDYCISREGILLYKPTGAKISAIKSTTSNYYFFSLYKGLSGRKMLLRHRLMCMVFRPTTADISKLAVNHINGIPGDDRPENLEWVSHHENTLLAGILQKSPKCKPVELLTLATQELKVFVSAKECADYLGYHKDTLLYWLNDRPNTIKNGRVIRWYSQHNEPWPGTLQNIAWRKGKVRRLITRNLVTGEEKEYEKMSLLADELNIPLVTLWGLVTRHHHPVLFAKLQVKFAEDTRPWREVDNPTAEWVLLTNQKPVEVLNRVTGRLTVFLSVTACAKHFGIKTTTLHNRLAKSFDKVYDNHSFRYYKYI